MDFSDAVQSPHSGAAVYIRGLRLRTALLASDNHHPDLCLGVRFLAG